MFLNESDKCFKMFYLKKILKLKLLVFFIITLVLSIQIYANN